MSRERGKKKPSLEDTLDDGYLGRGPDKLATVFFFVLFLLALAGLFFLAYPYLTDIILAGAFTVLVLPAHRWLLRKAKHPLLAASGSVLLIFLLVAGPFTFLVTSLTVEAGSAIEATKDNVTIDKAQEWLFGEGTVASTVRTAADMVGIEYTPDSVKSTLTQVAGTIAKVIYSQANALVSNVLAATFHFLLILLMVFYLLVDGRRLKRFLFRLSPLPDEEEELLITKFADVGRATLVGNGVGSVLQGILGGIAMAVVGLPSPILWGTVMSVFAFLPLVGISVVVIPATAYLALEERFMTALLFFGFCMAEGFFVENVVKTKLIGDHMKMHNMVIFMAIIAGITLFGVLGILYGPLIVALFLALAELYQSHYQFRFMTEEESAAAKTITLPKQVD